MANFNFRDYINIGAMSAMGYALGWFPSTIFFSFDLLLEKTNLSVVCFYIRLLFFTYIYLRTYTYVRK